MIKQFSIAKLTGYLYCLAGFLTLIVLGVKGGFESNLVFTISLSLVPILIGIGLLKGSRMIAVFSPVALLGWGFYILVPIAVATAFAGVFPLWVSQLGFVFFAVLFVLTILTILTGIKKSNHN